MKKTILSVLSLLIAISVFFLVSSSSERKPHIDDKQPVHQEDVLSRKHKKEQGQHYSISHSKPIEDAKSDVNTNNSGLETINQVELTPYEKFAVEEIDYNWSYDYENNIRDSLYQTLDADFVHIELLECRTTICKLKISPSENTTNFKQTTVNSLSIISKSEWNKGSIKLHRFLPSSKQAFAELYITK